MDVSPTDQVKDVHELLNDLLRPTYVLRMAGAMLNAPREAMSKGANTRYRNATFEIQRLLCLWAARRMSQGGHQGAMTRVTHPGYVGDPRTCIYGSFGWTWINDGENLVCPVCGLDGT